MKLKAITEQHGDLLDRIQHEVKKKAPKAGKKLLSRVKSFKTWHENQ